MLIFQGVPEMEGFLMLTAGHVGGGETPQRYAGNPNQLKQVSTKFVEHSI